MNKTKASKGARVESGSQDDMPDSECLSRKDDENYGDGMRTAPGNTHEDTIVIDGQVFSRKRLMLLDKAGRKIARRLGSAILSASPGPDKWH